MLLGYLGNGFRAKTSGIGSELIREKKIIVNAKQSINTGFHLEMKVECREVSSINKADLTLATNLKN